LYVTWAKVVDKAQRNAVERYLAAELRPQIGLRFPRTRPHAVNLPPVWIGDESYEWYEPPEAIWSKLLSP
jgi:hypothetical protein